MTPKMWKALYAMERAPIDYRPDGWISRADKYGPWNTHTLQWLASRGLVHLQPRVSAKLTSAGRQLVERTPAQ